ncbi:hypothetical protein HNQ59_000808 [Chitinivorax tropicus]|uniref:Uncharacterized protein n=1 Tax=Chitinivorax tropicus TaxID=714531 RepID=A0A840MK55_9PROT|nr:hypothetical protein [Chitinivorax tropicus]MBB5017539.1 hypothetical protein [Chitinivorax tropicus]
MQDTEPDQPVPEQLQTGVECPVPASPDSWRYYGTWCGYCEFCGEYFTLTLTPQHDHARCPYCFVKNDRNKFWPQWLGI